MIVLASGITKSRHRANPMPAPSYRQYVHVTHRLLAPALRDSHTNATSERFSDCIGIASTATRQRLECLDQRIAHCLIHRAAIAITLWNPDEIERWIIEQFAFVRNRDCDRYGAGKAQPSAIGDRAGLCFDQQNSILVD